MAAKIHIPAGQPKPPLATEPQGTGAYWKAAYLLDATYRETMDRWSETFDTAPNTGSVDLNIQAAMKKSWKDLGHEQVSAGFDAQCAGIISVGIRGMKADQYETAGMENYTSGVSISVDWKELQYFSVDPGTW